MKHIASFSGGKDSAAMVIKMIEKGMPLDDIVFIKVMATPTLGADYPEMYEYIDRFERYIQRKITIVPSIMSFDEGFHEIYKKGKRAGIKYGFPLIVGAWCNDRLKLRAINKHYKTYGDHIRYLGLAADEPERLAKLRASCRAPLAEWGMTEADCIAFLKERDLLNPLYKKFKRLGCWFCPKQSLDSLRILRHDYPDLWNMILEWDKESPRTFKPDCTVYDLEQRFGLEDCQIKMWDDEKVFDIESFFANKKPPQIIVPRNENQEEDMQQLSIWDMSDQHAA